MKMLMPKNWRFDDYYAIRLVDYLIKNPGKKISDEYCIDWKNARGYIKIMRRVCRTYGKNWYTNEQIKTFNKAIYAEHKEDLIFVTDYTLPCWVDYFEKEKKHDIIMYRPTFDKIKDLNIEYKRSHGRFGIRWICDEENYKKLMSIQGIGNSISLFKKRYVKNKLMYYVNIYDLEKHMNAIREEIKKEHHNGWCMS